MGPRRTILRLLLWSLGFAAAAGVFAVLFAIDEIMFRVMWTGFATAIAAALAMPLSMMIDRQRTKAAGIFGVAVVVLEFILCLVLIWIVWILSGRRLEDRVIITIWTVCPLGLAGMVFCLLVASKSARIAGFTGLVVTAASFISFQVATWWPTSYWDEEPWVTGFVILGCGLLIAFALFGVEAKPRRHWRWIGIAGAVIAGALMIMDIWDGPDSEEAVAIFLSLGIVIPYAILVLHAPLKPGQRWLAMASIAAATGTALFIDILVLDFNLVPDDLLERFAAAAGILTACGSMALLVLGALNRRGEITRKTASWLEMIVICPRCRKKQPVSIGSSTCAGCGLRFQLSIEEPRCPECEYLLHGITSDRCPECGATIRTLAAGPTP